MLVRSTDPERLSRMLVDYIDGNSPFHSTDVATEKLVEITAERNNLLLQSSHYKLPKETLDRKSFETRGYCEDDGNFREAAGKEGMLLTGRD